MTTKTDEICRLAISLARSAGYAVFPVKLVIRSNGRADKMPLIEKWPERASADPAEIARLWHERPGDLIGIVTGARSGVSVVDLDRKHQNAVAFWQENHRRLLPTRCFATHSGGLHLYYRHRDGITNTQGKLCLGVDTRGEGGFIVYWFAWGCDCLDHTAPQPFPDWLYRKLTYQPPPVPRTAMTPNPDRAIDGILRKLAQAREGERNSVLFWCACKLAEHGMGQPEIEALLLPIAQSIGLSDTRETRASINSAMRRAAA
jgi:hypothetical protein